MSHIPDAIIYFTILLMTLAFLFCGIYFSSNKTLGIWSLFAGIVLGLLTVFLYWQNDVWKSRASNKPDTQSQQIEEAKANYKASQIPTPSKKIPNLPKTADVQAPNINQTPHSRLTNVQLQKETLILVDKMHSYLELKHLQQQSRSDYYRQQMRQANTDQERQIIWDAETHDSLTSPSLNFEYSEKFKADAILLRNELLSRLPKDYKTEKNHSDYDHPTNPIGLNIVIDDLEKMAKSLSK